jgi:hypothetical protein
MQASVAEEEANIGQSTICVIAVTDAEPADDDGAKRQ